MLKGADNPPTPKRIQILYRCGVALNVGWLFKKHKLVLENIYMEDKNDGR